ncbi:MAG TPA: methyltransferase domain-containing protein, partial [Pirellulales bacterium]|nr:methyltransferase domain-containing protein [Pirellulales bacterium]
VIPPAAERSTYVLASSLLLLLLFWQWRPLPGVVWSFDSPVAAGLLWASFTVGWLIVFVSTFLINHFDLLGLRQVYLSFIGKPYSPPPFQTPLFYRIVRHPLMLGFLIAFWAAPTMTYGHLLFAAVVTAYVLVAVRLEERDLLAYYGQTYSVYQGQVRMLLPLPTGAGRPTNPMDRLAGEYDQWFDSPEGKAIFEQELDCVRHVKGSEAGRWLEVGVGTGRFAAALGIREGTDPSEPALALARSRGVDVLHGEAEKLPYQDGTFDGILVVVTLCFVADPPGAMAECRRVLKPGGRVVIGIIPANSPWGRLYAEKGRQGHPFYSTAHFHTAGEVISLAENAGFAFTGACSCLLDPPNSPQEKRFEKDVVESAGFACLGFSKPQPN